MFHRCREIGINLFDCADIYAQGRGEEILGKLIKDCRDEIILTSKVSGTTGADVNARSKSGLTPLMAAVSGGNIELVALLLETGAEANARTAGGRGALSCRSGDSNVDVQIHRLLRGAGATDPNTRKVMLM